LAIGPQRKLLTTTARDAIARRVPQGAIGRATRVLRRQPSWLERLREAEFATDREF
jgi:hypothetical protein